MSEDSKPARSLLFKNADLGIFILYIVQYIKHFVDMWILSEKEQIYSLLF
jgi:hypothetical protein